MGQGIADNPEGEVGDEDREHERAIAAVRRTLGDPAFLTAWNMGRALPLGEAVAEALAEADVD